MQKDLEVLADSRFYTVRDVAKITGYRVRTVRYFLAQHLLKSVKIRGKHYISGREVKRFTNDYKGRKYSAGIKEG